MRSENIARRRRCRGLFGHTLTDAQRRSGELQDKRLEELNTG
jgi:hypothetical protein